MYKKGFVMIIVLSLLAAVTACGIGRPGADKAQAPAETQVVNRMGDLRVKGEALFYTPPAAEVSNRSAQSPGAAGGVASQTTSDRKPGPVEGSISTIASGRSGSGNGAVSTGQAEIEQYYMGRLRSLASGYESKIMGLYSSGVQEIMSIPASDSKARSAAAGRCYSSGRALEAECDGQFYKLLGAFEGELQANGYPLDKAREAQAVYESSKQSRADQLINMALGSVGGVNKQ